MLPKNRRIPRKLFKTLLESKKYYNSEHFTLRVAPSGDARIAVTVSKKVSKSAVVRNKIRRRTYGALEHLIPSMTSNLYLLIAKSGAGVTSGRSLSDELAQLFKKR